MAGAVVAMLATVAPLALSGYATHVQWVGDALEELHEFLAHAMLVLVLLHLSLLALLSAMRRQNQARPMLTGRIRGAGPDRSSAQDASDAAGSASARATSSTKRPAQRLARRSSPSSAAARPSAPGCAPATPSSRSI